MTDAATRILVKVETVLVDMRPLIGLLGFQEIREDVQRRVWTLRRKCGRCAFTCLCMRLVRFEALCMVASTSTSEPSENPFGHFLNC